MKTIKSIRKLVTDECACYSPILNDIKDYCDREQDKDCRCLIFKDKRCGYFERAVLPMNPQLEALYKAEHQAKKEGHKLSNQYKEQILEEKISAKGKVKIYCKRCGEIFLANNHKRQYCKKCKRIILIEKRYAKSQNTP